MPEDELTSRERLRLALDHKEPDRVPFDLGATVVTTIHVTAYDALRKHLRLPTVEPQLSSTYSQITLVDDDIVDALGVDARGVTPPHEAVIEEDEEYHFFYDTYGIGWRMPKNGGHYYDMFNHPLAGDVTVEDIESFPWPDAADPKHLEGLREKALHIINEEQRAAVLCNLTSSGPLEAHLRLRGYEEGFMDFVNNPRGVHALMDKIVEMKFAFWDKALAELGDVVDVIGEWDDLGGQHALLVSPDTYRTFIKPRHQQVFDFIHSRTDAKIFFHCDGAIRQVIPDLIESGVDILNPLQVSAADMDSADIKREFGSDLSFWGGGVDTQNVLATATPDGVREDAKRRLNDLMTDGGFVFTPVHNIQDNVPPENLIAMWETVQEYGVYSAA